MLLTIFTPTYNRAALLPRLYGSICRQTCADFEWLIVDDGSTDNTHEVINAIKSENNKFDIRYIYKENDGKHRAVNLGVKEARGELFLIVDSDDILPEKSIETIRKCYREIEHDSSFGGLCGLDADFNGKIIGNSLPQNYIDSNSLEIRSKWKIRGDLKEIFRTAVLKEFSFPEIEGEKFCPEVLVWNRIARKYKLRFFNKVVYSVEYQQEGLTANIVKIRMNSPIASMMTYAEMAQYKRAPISLKMRAAINYWRFRFCSTDKKATKPHISPLWLLVRPIAWLIHKKDIISVKTSTN